MTNNTMVKHTFGWVPDRPDHRDHFYAAPHHFLRLLPSHIDLRNGCPGVYDQLDLGSCTANAIAGALEFDQIKQGEQVYTPSRLFIYYNERVIEHSVSEDAGAAIRDGIKSVNKQGDCNEIEWPYDITKFAIAPPATCYKDASQHKSVSYQRVTRSLNQMKGCLAAGSPFVIGFTVYESFESNQVAQTGNMPMPRADESVLGGHAVLVVGYDDSRQVWIVRNSWGSEWGGPMKGYFTMPYAYLLDSGLSSDFWTIRSIQ